MSSLGVPGVTWHPQILADQLKFIYSEKATKLCEISTVDLSYVVPEKSTVEISQNFVAFSECMSFKTQEKNILIYITCNYIFISNIMRNLELDHFILIVILASFL